MSIQAMTWVLDWSESTLADRLVLLAIANHCDARGMNAWPAIETIAEEARVGRTTVYRAIDALESIGEITVVRRPGRSNYYGITALMGSQIGTGEGSQSGTAGVPNTRKRGPKLVPKPSVTVNEPAQVVTNFERTPLPPALDAETRRRGAEFMRAIRRGEAPA